MKHKTVISVLVLAIILAGVALVVCRSGCRGPIQGPTPDGYERQEGLPDFVGDKPPGPEPLAIFGSGKNEVVVSVFTDYTTENQFSMVCLGRSIDFDRVKNVHGLPEDDPLWTDVVPIEFHREKTICWEIYLHPGEESQNLLTGYYFPSKRGVFMVTFEQRVNGRQEHDEALAFQRDYVERLRAAAK